MRPQYGFVYTVRFPKIVRWAGGLGGSFTNQRSTSENQFMEKCLVLYSGGNVLICRPIA